jgi:hypothetical protein
MSCVYSSCARLPGKMEDSQGQGVYLFVLPTILLKIILSLKSISVRDFFRIFRLYNLVFL